MRWRLCLLFGLAFAGCGVPRADPWAAGFSNRLCPVQGGEVVTDDPELVVEHEGRKIGFCCAGCPEQFRRDPAKYLQRMREDSARYGFRE